MGESSTFAAVSYILNVNILSEDAGFSHKISFTAFTFNIQIQIFIKTFRVYFINISITVLFRMLVGIVTETCVVCTWSCYDIS